MLKYNGNFEYCSECNAEFNSELMNEYNFDFCPYCGKQLHQNVMENYTFHIENILLAHETVRARSKQEAIILIRQMYDRGEINVDEIDSVSIKDDEWEEV